ncbi:MAG: pyruvate kinase [Chloroflexota bacterium]|nr:pyruvate kinase [Chloroflexota bacterium]
MTPPTTTIAPRDLLDSMRGLYGEVVRDGQTIYARWTDHITRRAMCLGAINLANYLALRAHDLRALQPGLSHYGMSSLGRAEGRVLPNLEAVIAALEAITDVPAPERTPFPNTKRASRGARLLRANTDQVFGATPAYRTVRIMVTYPSEAASDYDFVRDLVARGMNVARINCAHDSAADWEAMIAFTQRAARETGHAVRIHMDLGGPKVRTADLLLDDKRAYVGDTLLLTRAVPRQRQDYPKQIRCTLPAVLDQVAVGEAVWIDDGLIGTVIVGMHADGAVLRVTHAEDEGVRLKEEKGLNFPDTDLHLSPLTDDDLSALDFIADHADSIGYSFVQDTADIDLLQGELAKRRDDWRRIALIAKIETRRAVRNLPDLIVRAGGVQPFGVMIARGDLAVEVGYLRMAEIQEEILWLCEAAHIPVIWATQVLESFVKRGTPSRGEMTDAAMGARAECVMLNKGQHVGEAVTILGDLLTRMQQHQVKKTPQLRALKQWQDVMGD